MKIAKYADEGGWESIDKKGWIDESPRYIRTTEYVEVEFVPLPKEDVVPKQVKALENAKAEARAKFQVAINAIDEKIAKLLAIEDHSND